MNCTVATELMRDLVNKTLKEFNDEINKIPPGSSGLITLPFFNGERTPNLPDGKASIIGLTSQNCSSAHILRSSVEGATYALRYGLDELISLGLSVEKIILIGGGSKSAPWRQIVADIFQLPVEILNIEEGASFGAALQALWVLLLQDDANLALATIISEHLSIKGSESIEPNKDNKSIYEQGFKNYQNAVNQVSPLFQ